MSEVFVLVNFVFVFMVTTFRSHDILANTSSWEQIIRHSDILSANYKTGQLEMSCDKIIYTSETGQTLQTRAFILDSFYQHSTITSFVSLIVVVMKMYLSDTQL